MLALPFFTWFNSLVGGDLLFEDGLLRVWTAFKSEVIVVQLTIYRKCSLPIPCV